MIHYGLCPSACVIITPVTLPSGLNTEVFECYLAMQSRFKIQVTNTACGQLQWQQEASERFEFQYPESMWYNVSKEQAASSCLPTRPVQPSVDGVFILCSLEVSVFWFVTVDQDHCRKAFFSSFLFSGVKWVLKFHTYVIAWEYPVNELKQNMKCKAKKMMFTWTVYKQSEDR